MERWHAEVDNDVGVTEDEQTENTQGEHVEARAAEAGVLDMIRENRDDTPRQFGFISRYDPFNGIKQYVYLELVMRLRMSASLFRRLITRSQKAETGGVEAIYTESALRVKINAQYPGAPV